MHNIDCGTPAVYAARGAELWLYMPYGLRNLGRICRIDCGSLLYATWTAEFRRRASHVENLITVPLQLPRHNVPHPIPKHTDKSQHRTPHHNPRTPKKSPRGVQRGRGFTAPLRFSTASQSKKTRPSAKKPKLKPKTNHTINKEKENHKEK